MIQQEKATVQNVTTIEAQNTHTHTGTLAHTYTHMHTCRSAHTYMHTKTKKFI